MRVLPESNNIRRKKTLVKPLFYDYTARHHKLLHSLGKVAPLKHGIWKYARKTCQFSPPRYCGGSISEWEDFPVASWISLTHIKTTALWGACLKIHTSCAAPRLSPMSQFHVFMGKRKRMPRLNRENCGPVVLQVISHNIKQAECVGSSSATDVGLPAPCKKRDNLVRPKIQDSDNPKLVLSCPSMTQHSCESWLTAVPPSPKKSRNICQSSYAGSYSLQSKKSSQCWWLSGS